MKKFFLYFLSILLWVLVIILIIASFAIGVGWGLLLIVLTIATHIFFASKAKKKAITRTSKATNNIKPNEITKDYYEQISKVVEDLMFEYKYACQSPKFKESLAKSSISLKKNGGKPTDITEQVQMLFWIDLTRCYIGLGHQIDLNSKAGFGLLYAIARVCGMSPLSYLQHKKIYTSSYYHQVEEIVKAVVQTVSASDVLSERFAIAHIYGMYDEKRKQKYLVHLYRFASITAKADNVITEDEADWLSEIMQLQKGEGNVRIEDDDLPNEPDEEIPSFNSVNTPLDPLFADVARWVVENQEGSTSKMQRHFEIGYNRAGKLADQLEALGIVGANRGAYGREVLIQDKDQLEQILAGTMGTKPKTQDTSATQSKPKRIAAKTELKNLIGLASVKEEVEALTNYIRIQNTREEKGMKTSPISYHCVFTGNPGTGKTTVARILAKIYKSLGVVSKGHLVETDRSGLVAEYVGQTAVKTNKIIDSALDGVLFIDEAYSLIAGGENDYGKEAIATLLKRMEDDRNRLVVILAGYTKEMKDFIDSNPGLQSRFNRYIEFPDYDADDLYLIFCKQLKQFDYTMSDEAAEALKTYLAYQVEHKDKNFGNARFVRNAFERTLQQQANRLSKEVNLTTQKLAKIEKEDLPIN